MSKETKNTYGLPQGEKIRRELVAIFKRQRAAIDRFLKTGKKDDHDSNLPPSFPPFDDFGMGALKLHERFTPMLRVYWEQGGKGLYSRVGLDPDEWSVVNPHTEEMIDTAALDFCEATNATTSLSLDEALKKTKAELAEGIVEKGESLRLLTKRVSAIFDGAEKYRAKAIAATETSRAIHAANEQAAIESEVVTGWEWLLSSDACPLCQTVGRRAKFVKLGQPFAVIGDHPTYSQVRFPPLHPNDQCTVIEVLDTDKQPEWSPTLIQPKPEDQDIPEEERPKKPTPKPTPQPKPGKPRTPKPTPQPKPRPERKPKPKPEPKPVEPIPQPKPEPKPSKPVAAPVVPPKPIEPPKPAEPEPPKPGERLLPTKPIKDRIAAWKDGDAKLEILKKIDSSTLTAALDEIKQCEAEAKVIHKRKVFSDDDIEALGLLNLRTRAATDLANVARMDMIATVGKALEIPDSKNEGLKIGSSGANPSQVADRINAAHDFYGRACREGSNPVQVGYDVKLTREYYDPRTKNLVISEYTHVGVVAHEQAHAIEHQNPEIDRRAKEFLAYRVGDEVPTKMTKVAPGKGYGKDEMGRKDDFDRHFDKVAAYYVGKDYRVGTEILSMGIEALLKNPAGFAKDDPEYCKFVLGILSGELR